MGVLSRIVYQKRNKTSTKKWPLKNWLICLLTFQFVMVWKGKTIAIHPVCIKMPALSVLSNKLRFIWYNVNCVSWMRHHSLTTKHVKSCLGGSGKQCFWQHPSRIPYKCMNGQCLAQYICSVFTAFMTLFSDQTHFIRSFERFGL